MPSIFWSDAGIMPIFHLQNRIWDSHFPSTCNPYEGYCGSSVTHWTCVLKDPGSSMGVNKKFFVHFFSFSLYTLSFFMNIARYRIENNAIKNPFYVILFSLYMLPLCEMPLSPNSTFIPLYVIPLLHYITTLHSFILHYNFLNTH